MSHSQYEGYLIGGKLISFLSKRVIDKLKQQEITMTTKEKIKVMQGYLNGKQIEVRELDEELWILYAGGLEPRWNWLERDYRIKPEPKYRPLKPEELHELKGKWLISNKSKNLAMVTGINSELTRVLINGIWWTASALFTGATFEDGSPVGKME